MKTSQHKTSTVKNYNRCFGFSSVYLIKCNECVLYPMSFWKLLKFADTLKSFWFCSMVSFEATHKCCRAKYFVIFFFYFFFTTLWLICRTSCFLVTTDIVLCTTNLKLDGDILHHLKLCTCAWVINNLRRKQSVNELEEYHRNISAHFTEMTKTKTKQKHDKDFDIYFYICYTILTQGLVLKLWSYHKVLINRCKCLNISWLWVPLGHTITCLFS